MSKSEGSPDMPSNSVPPLGMAQHGMPQPGMPQMDRRTCVGRREQSGDTRTTYIDDTGLERRRGPGRRRTDFAKSAEEGEMSSEQFLFVTAIDAFKRVNNRPFPTWTEVLEVIRKLGYRKTCESTLNLSNAEDWTEAADATAFKTVARLPMPGETADERYGAD